MASLKIISDIQVFPRLLRKVRNWPDFLLDHFKLKHTPYEICLRNGLRIAVRPGTTDKGAFVEVHLSEDYLLALDHIKNAKVIMDIGAQIGTFSLYAHQLNPTAKIYSFEASAANHACLQNNIRINRADNITPFHKAVVSESREVKLFLSESNTGGHSLYQQTGKAEVVQGMGINEIFDTLKLAQCDLIKMDCEGAELEIVAAMNTENLSKTRAIIMEYHDAARVSEIESKLKKHNFHVHIPRYPLLFAWKE